MYVTDTVQLQRACSVIDALSAKAQALSINSADAIKLTAQVSFRCGLTQTSYLQFSRSVLSWREGLANFEAVRKMLDLAQLASRVASAMHAQTSNGVDPFAKVKGLIREMIARLEEKASADPSRW